MTIADDLERARSVAIALEAEVAALREVLAAIRDGAVVPYPVPVPPEPAATYAERAQRVRDAVARAQRSRAIQVRSAARWALGERWDEPRWTSDAETILIAARTLRHECAWPLGYEPEGGG